MSTIPTSLTEKQFDEHIRPYISVAKRGYESKVPLFKIFNYLLYHLHTGCQGYQLPIEPSPHAPEKRRSVMMLFTTIFASGAETVACKRSGKRVL